MLENSSQHISLLPNSGLNDENSRMTVTDSTFQQESVFKPRQYFTSINILCAFLVVVLMPTFLVDTMILNKINSDAHLAIIFVLLVVIIISLITNNILSAALENISLELTNVHRNVAFVGTTFFGVSLATVYYDYSGWSILMQIFFRLELSILILTLVYLQLSTKEKTSILLKSFIIHRDTLEMIEEDRHLAHDYYDVEVKKRRIIDKKSQLLFLQKSLTSKLILSCIVVSLLIVLGLISLEFWSEKIRFMIFLYASFTTPIVFSTHQITHYNEKIMAIESDLRIRTSLRVKLFGWVPRRELIFGTIVSLTVNAIRIFAPI